MPDAISALQYNNNFLTVDVTEDNSSDVQSQPNVTQVGNTNVAYRATNGIEDPTGTWIVGDQRVDAGTVVMATIYNSWLSANDRASTHLNAMSVNASLAKASSALSTAITAHEGPLTYDQLLTMAGTAIQGTGVTMSASGFLSTVLPDVNSSSSFVASETKALADTASQFSSARLTDNSVLQQKYDVATALINTLQEAMSNVLKAWTGILQALAKNV